MITADAPIDLHGLWVPLVTPFTLDDRVDEPALARLCARVLDDGARGSWPWAPPVNPPC